MSVPGPVLLIAPDASAIVSVSPSGTKSSPPSPLIANAESVPCKTVVPFTKRTVPEPVRVASEKSFVPAPPNVSTPLSETVIA